MSAQTYEDFLRGQAEKAQYGVVIIPARTALDMADFIEKMRANGTDINAGSTISRDMAIDAVKHAWAKGLEPTQYLEELPSAQPEIIHCRDCRYYIPYDWMFDGLTRSSNINDYSQDEIGCAVNDHNYPPDGYCSNAERRSE